MSRQFTCKNLFLKALNLRKKTLMSIPSTVVKKGKLKTVQFSIQELKKNIFVAPLPGIFCRFYILKLMNKSLYIILV